MGLNMPLDEGTATSGSVATTKRDLLSNCSVFTGRAKLWGQVAGTAGPSNR
jgi:hypothetical protein